MSQIGAGVRNNVMRFPPAKYYQIEGLDTNTWLTNDFESFVRNNIPNVEKQNVFLVPDAQTESEVESERPTYPIIYIDESGELVPLMDSNGQRVRYQPDVIGAINKYNKEMQELQSKQMNVKAKSERALKASRYNSNRFWE